MSDSIFQFQIDTQSKGSDTFLVKGTVLNDKKTREKICKSLNGKVLVKKINDEICIVTDSNSKNMKILKKYKNEFIGENPLTITTKNADDMGKNNKKDRNDRKGIERKPSPNSLDLLHGQKFKSSKNYTKEMKEDSETSTEEDETDESVDSEASTPTPSPRNSAISNHLDNYLHNRIVRKSSKEEINGDVDSDNEDIVTLSRHIRYIKNRLNDHHALLDEIQRSLQKK